MSELAELKVLLDNQGKAWEEFKAANDARVEAIEKKNFAPADLEGKVDTINTDMDRLSKEIADIMKKMNRPGAGASNDTLTPDQLEHKQALDRYLRKGKEDGLAELERKAMFTGSDPDGGFLVDSEMDGQIDRIAATISGMRGVAAVRTVGANSYKKMVKTRGVAGGHIGETEDSAETNAPQYALIEIVPERIYAEPWVSNDMLEDAEFDLEADLTEEAGITFGEIEGADFITGTGVKMARGILTYTTVANASYSWGNLGYVASGAAGAWASSNPSDKLIDLVHALKRQYRPGAGFMMNDLTIGSVRKFKETTGNYLWAPGLMPGQPDMLLGYPVVHDDNLPDIAADSLSVAFGNFARGYTIVDRRGIAVIRDNVTKKGYTKFHFSKRVSGGVHNFEAIKLMKFATS
ncbi:MAG: phage major capsid protein [Arhodomonas sp.]|nr:phage major capsid protein [Arhodomonas sp.]